MMAMVKAVLMQRGSKHMLTEEPPVLVKGIFCAFGKHAHCQAIL